MLRLSKHFFKNWRQRVGGDPDPVEIDKIIRESIRVQKGKCARTYSGMFKTLTIYWHVDLGLMLTADHFRNNAVSVYSKANMPPGCTLSIGETMG